MTDKCPKSLGPHNWVTISTARPAGHTCRGGGYCHHSTVRCTICGQVEADWWFTEEVR